ncbi:hypothetical protein ACOSQ3_019371 [Xanthoceras sorbifolium]
MVRTWLINSMQPTIFAWYLFTNNVALIWDSFQKVYSQRENNARTFQFSSEIENFKHGTQSPGTYYGSFDWPEKELSLYDSFIDWLASAVGATTPLPSTTVEIYENTMEKNRVFQFLAGLNSEFEYARVHLLDKISISHSRGGILILPFGLDS